MLYNLRSVGILTLLLFSFTTSRTQDYYNSRLLPTMPLEKQDSCIVGIYIFNIYDLDVENDCFSAEFLLWFNFSNDSLDFSYPVRIDNSKDSEFDGAGLFDSKTYCDYHWVTQYYTSKIVHDWDIVSYPFDKQMLYFRLEDNNYLASEVKYIADTGRSMINPDIELNDYIIESITIFDSVFQYKTNFGNPILPGYSSFPFVGVTIDLVRKNPWITFYKLVVGVYVAFFIAVVVFFIKHSDVDPRFGLCVGALFAAIGNKYIIESNVPASASLTLMDQIHNLTFIMILAVVIISIITVRLSRKKNKQILAKRIDKISFFIITALYIFLNVLFVMLAQP